MRNIKTLNFYELNLESHPFSFRLTSKQPATNEYNHMTHMSYVSPSSICNIMNYGDCLEHLQLFIRQREGNDQVATGQSIKIHIDDKVLLLNQTYA